VTKRSSARLTVALRKQRSYVRIVSGALFLILQRDMRAWTETPALRHSSTQATLVEKLSPNADAVWKPHRTIILVHKRPTRNPTRTVLMSASLIGRSGSSTFRLSTSVQRPPRLTWIFGTGQARRRWRDRSAPPRGQHRGSSSGAGTPHRPARWPASGGAG
jgi:hypothetical protein